MLARNKQIKEDFSIWSVRTEHTYDLIWLVKSFLCLEKKEEEKTFTTEWVLFKHYHQSTSESREWDARCSQHKHLEGPGPGLETPCPWPPATSSKLRPATLPGLSQYLLHSALWGRARGTARNFPFTTTDHSPGPHHSHPQFAQLLCLFSQATKTANTGSFFLKSPEEMRVEKDTVCSHKFTMLSAYFQEYLKQLTIILFFFHWSLFSNEK